MFLKKKDKSISLRAVIKDYQSLLIFALTALLALGANLLTLINYACLNILCNSWDMNINLVIEGNQNNVFYNLLLAIINMLLIYYASKQFATTVNTKKFSKIKKILIVLFNNFLLAILNVKAFSNFLASALLFILIMPILEYGLMKFMEKNPIIESTTNEDTKKIISIISSINSIITVIELIVLSIAIGTFSTNYLSKTFGLSGNYKLIDNNKVIMYTTNDYYITLDCTLINNDKLIIYTGTEQKLNTQSLEVKNYSIKKVEKKTNTSK